jgi:hypothetical protein
MDNSDPIYSIVVKMADTLVPDVCHLIIERLEQIHINLGHQKWQNKIRAVNNEYQEGWFCFGDDMANMVWRPSTLRNYRILTETHPLYGINGNRYIDNFSMVTKITTEGVCLLPENYVHAKLYNEDLNIINMQKICFQITRKTDYM